LFDYIPLKNFSLIWRRHHCRWRAANLSLCSALRAFEQGGGGLYRATPAVSRDLGFSGLIQRTAPFSRLLRHMRGCGGSRGNTRQPKYVTGCISFACPEHSERILSYETHQNRVRGQPEQCSACTTFTGMQSGQNMADRVKRDQTVEHDRYLTLIVAQVHLVQ
jgi:hypothetical protein